MLVCCDLSGLSCFVLLRWTCSAELAKACGGLRALPGCVTNVLLHACRI
jgi:hypothetical protein